MILTLWSKCIALPYTCSTYSVYLFICFIFYLFLSIDNITLLVVADDDVVVVYLFFNSFCCSCSEFSMGFTFLSIISTLLLVLPLCIRTLLSICYLCFVFAFVLIQFVNSLYFQKLFSSVSLWFSISSFRLDWCVDYCKYGYQQNQCRKL